MNHLETDTSDTPEVFGCKSCKLIYDPQLYYFEKRNTRLNINKYCPYCGHTGLIVLGNLPSVAGPDNKMYLTDEDGSNQLGPFKGYNSAMQHLWEWFEKGNKNGEEENKKIISIKNRNSKN